MSSRQFLQIILISIKIKKLWQDIYYIPYADIRQSNDVIWFRNQDKKN